MSERVAIYVDGANVYFAQKEALGWWIDWPRFLEAMRDGGKTVVSARWYQAFRSDPETEQERFLHHLSLVGFAVTKRVLKTVYDRNSGHSSQKGDLDVDLAIDAITEAAQFDTAILVTGDSDYVPLVEALQSRGKRVVVAATTQNVAVELRAAVGVNFLDLTTLREAVESDKKAPERREERRPAPVGNRRDYDEDDGEFEDSYDDDYDDDEEYDDEPLGPDDIDLPADGTRVRARVQAVKRYGVFLDLHENVKTLLHVKDMNRGFVPDAAEFYAVGDEVMVEIVSVDWERQPPEVRVAVVTPEPEYEEN